VLRRALGAGQADIVGIGQIGRVRILELLLRDLRLVEHRLEDDAAPGLGGVGIRDRVVPVRIGRNPREQRRFGQGQVLRTVLEVGERGLLDAVRPVAEVDRVQVALQDPLLPPALVVSLELPGERGLAHLAGDRLLVAVERVLDELLCDRGAALDDPLVADVGDERATDAAQVDPVVLPETAILDRDDRMPHRVGDLVVADQRACLGAAQHGEHPW
jgi:hypothetical protein